MKNNLGVTFTELLIIIGIMIALAAMAVPAFYYFQTESDLNNSVEEIINTLRFAQNKTLASEGASNYGVYFENNKYVLFKGTSYNPLSTNNEIHNLPATVEIYKIDLPGGGFEVIFDRITGATNQPGNLYLRLKKDFSKTRTTNIKPSGQIVLGPETNPTALPQKDSRHVHFNLGWSIQNATTLKFNFISLGQIETVDMPAYFNATKTNFDWEGRFSAGGTDQAFRIHTHSLDTFSTLLCIHRDRNNGKNNQEVIIYIVDGGADKDIAHYLANTADAVEKGFYVNAMERQ